MQTPSKEKSLDNEEPCVICNIIFHMQTPSKGKSLDNEEPCVIFNIIFTGESIKTINHFKLISNQFTSYKLQHSSRMGSSVPAFPTPRCPEISLYFCRETLSATFFILKTKLWQIPLLRFNAKHVYSPGIMELALLTFALRGTVYLKCAGQREYMEQCIRGGRDVQLILRQFSTR